MPFVRSKPHSDIFGCGFVVLPLDEVELDVETVEELCGFAELFVTEDELKEELLEELCEFAVLLVTEDEFDAELLEDSDEFVTLLVSDVEFEPELSADSDVFVVLFDMGSELVVELPDVLSLCDIDDGTDSLFEELLLLQAVAVRHIKAADKAAIILFILYTSFR